MAPECTHRPRGDPSGRRGVNGLAVAPSRDEVLAQSAAVAVGQPERHQAWGEAARARLFWGAVQGVRWGLQRMQPRDAAAAYELRT